MRKPRGYWTYYTCKKVALKCKTRNEFRKKYSRAWALARLGGFLDEICSHMKPLGSHYYRMVYIYMFPNYKRSKVAVYIGLTCDEDKRHADHVTNNDSPVCKYMRKTGLKPLKMKASKGYIPVEEALKLEIRLIAQYRKDGFRVLNTHRGGGIGGGIRKWTFDECKKASLECKSVSEFRRKYSGGEDAARKNGWLKELFMQPLIIHNKWTFDECRKAALKCKYKVEFKNRFPSAYRKALNKGFLDDICSHMVTPPKYIKCTKEECKKAAKKCKNRNEFSKKHRHRYDLSNTNGWLNEYFPRN